MENYNVYVHTNKVNGKKYVGMTRLNPERRWENGFGYRKQTKFFDEILAYGWNNFEHEIIATGLSRMEARAMEAELINKYDTIENGYNKICGDYDEEGQPVPHGSEWYKARAKERGETEKYKDYQRTTPLRLVRCLETGKVYKNAGAAKAETGIDNSTIAKVCKGQRKSAGTHPETGEPLHWEYIYPNTDN